jgi:hypothetical protein
VTCGDRRIWPVNKLFRSRATAMVRVASCSVTGPRRDPLRSPGYQRKQDGMSVGTSQKPNSDPIGGNRTAGGDVAPSVGKVSFAIPLFLKMLEDIRAQKNLVPFRY